MSTFRSWVSEKFPFVKDKSYYQMLCGVTHYLDTVLKQSNMQELHTACRTLRDYSVDYTARSAEVDKELDRIASDGTLDSYFTNAMGGYLYVDALEGIEKYADLSTAEAHIETTTNAALLNMYRNSDIFRGVIFGSGYYPFESPIYLKTEMEMYSLGGNGHLVFAKSSDIETEKHGLTFKTGYYNMMYIHDLEIVSNTTCINFRPDTNCPSNVYDSKFERLSCIAYNGNCLYAGDNLSPVTGESITFHLEFNKIRVKSPNGAGFYGFGRLNTTYTQITDFGSIVNVFKNCFGIWNECNTSYASAHRFLDYDSQVPNYALSFVFNNCNMEDMCEGIIRVDVPNSGGIQLLQFNRCTMVIKHIGSDRISVHPLTFNTAQLNMIRFIETYLSFKGNKSWGDVFTMPECTFSLGTYQQLKSGAEGTFTCLIAGNRYYKIDSNKISVSSSYLGNNVVGGGGGSIDKPFIAVHQFTEADADSFYGGRAHRFKEIDVGSTANVNVNLRYLEDSGIVLYDGVILNNADSDFILRYVNLRTFKNFCNGQIFTVINNSGHDCTILTDDGYSTKFYLDSGDESRVLADGDSIYLLVGAINGATSTTKTICKELLTIHK